MLHQVSGTKSGTNKCNDTADMTLFTPKTQATCTQLFTRTPSGITECFGRRNCPVISRCHFPLQEKASHVFNDVTLVREQEWASFCSLHISVIHDDPAGVITYHFSTSAITSFVGWSPWHAVHGTLHISCPICSQSEHLGAEHVAV